MERQEPLFTLSKPKWSWVKINSQFKSKIDGKNCKVSLKPTITFEDTLTGEDRSNISQKIIVDTQKSLQYENEVGWNWHKSSNLPIISIKLEVKQQDSENLLPLPQNLQVPKLKFSLFFSIIFLDQARIFATKIIVNALQRDQIAFLEDVGIRGSSKIQLKDGCGFFSGIRFLSTSYNNQGVKFYLLIVIYSKTEGCQLNDIICSMLSPPIFVDSRKSARDYQQKRFLSFVQLFQPILFSKQFTKRQNKTKSDVEIKIGNNMDGLFNYLTAPNIRHKVKHPVFLSVKFSNVFKIFYNQTHFQNKQLTTIQFLKRMQRKLIRDIGGQKKNKKMTIKNYHKPFIITLIGQCNAHRKSKVMQCLQYLDCRAVQLVQYSYQIPEHYKDIAQTGDVVGAYTDNFSQLQKISFKDINARKSREEQAVQISVRDDFNDSEDEEKIKQQCKQENNLVNNKNLNGNAGKNSAEQINPQRTYGVYRRYRPEHKKHLKLQQNGQNLNKMRIDNQLNPIAVVTHNALQPLRVENQNNRIGSAFNLARINSQQRKKLKIQSKIVDQSQLGLLKLPFQANYPQNMYIPNLQAERILNIGNNTQLYAEQQQMRLINSQLSGAATVPLALQSLELSKDIFMQSMSHHPSKINMQHVKLEKQHLKNQVLSQIDMQNSFLQQLIVDNQMMKSKIQMLFEYNLMEQHGNLQNEHNRKFQTNGQQQNKQKQLNKNSDKNKEQ